MKVPPLKIVSKSWYLGETPVTDLTGTPFADYTPTDWAIYYIGSYGQIDGAHHKNWALDQVARILQEPSRS